MAPAILLEQGVGVIVFDCALFEVHTILETPAVTTNYHTRLFLRRVLRSAKPYVSTGLENKWVSDFLPDSTAPAQVATPPAPVDGLGRGPSKESLEASPRGSEKKDWLGILVKMFQMILKWTLCYVEETVWLEPTFWPYALFHSILFGQGWRWWEVSVQFHAKHFPEVHRLLPWSKWLCPLAFHDQLCYIKQVSPIATESYKWLWDQAGPECRGVLCSQCFFKALPMGALATKPLPITSVFVLRLFACPSLASPLDTLFRL